MTHFIYSTDPHGAGADWIAKVTQACEAYPSAQVVFGGDYIDRGKYSLETLNFVKYMVEEKAAVALLGNHEQLMLSALDEDLGALDLWSLNGGTATIQSFLGKHLIEAINGSMVDTILAYQGDLVNFVRSLPTYYTTDHIYFTHAGLDLSLPNPEDTDDEDKLWIRNSYIYDDNGRDFRHNSLDKVIVTGHTPTSYISGELDGEVISGGSDNEVLVIGYEGERHRIFADGGAAGGASAGHVLVLDEYGYITEIL